MTKDEIVKSQIVNKGQELFQQYGLKKTTMDEIAAACGKGKSTLYYYFKNKEEIFDAVIKKELINLRTIVKKQVDEEKSLKNKVSVYISAFHKEVISKANLYRIVSLEFISEATKEAHFKEIMQFEKAYLLRMFEDSYDACEFILIEKKDLPWFSEIMIAAFLGIVRYSIEIDHGFDQEKLDKAIDLLLPNLFW